MEHTATAEAIERLRRFAAYVEEDPANPDLLAEAWEAAMAAGDHAMAQRFAQAGERCDGHGAWLQRQAHSALAAGRSREAEALLLRAREGGMPTIDADHDLAFVALKEGDADRCVALLQPWIETLDHAPGSVARVQALWLRAMHRLRRLDPAWAWIEAQERGGRGLPPEVAAPASLIAIDADRFDAARTFADRALAQDEKAVDALTARGCVALAEGDSAAAARWLRSAEVVQPADGRIQSALGLVALHDGQFGEAQRRFELAVRALPRHVGSWHGLGWSWLLQGGLDRAMQAFRQAVDLDPNFGESHGAVGLVLVLQGRRDEAQAHLRRAHGLDPRNVTASFAQALGSGQLAPSQFHALARRLLDRPGFFGEKLSARWARDGETP
jgi:Flp pilus assembly protein TadD